jgi:hypothetical protein
MHSSLRTVLTIVALTALASPAPAQSDPEPEPAEPESPPATVEGESGDGDGKPKQPGRGDFDAGGQVRLPSGPDEMGEFATFNWVALDVEGRYFLLDSVTINGSMPLAVKKPDTYLGAEPSIIGGMTVTLEAKLPKMPFQPKKYEYDMKLVLGGSYMREGAMLLSNKDFPLFVGDFQPGFTGGALMRIKLSSAVDFSLDPVYVYQAGTDDSLMAVQIPMSTILAVGETLKLSADLGVYTGDEFSFSGDDGGRIAAGGSLEVKIGPIIAHAGAGVASLLTGGLYPTVGDSVYIDLNVKYAK